MNRKQTIASRITADGIWSEENGTFGTARDFWATLLAPWRSAEDPRGHLSVIHCATRREVERAILAAIRCECPVCKVASL